MHMLLSRQGSVAVHWVPERWKHSHLSYRLQSHLPLLSAGSLANSAHLTLFSAGYGFLSENATFARRCGEEGIQFIGPQAKTIEVNGGR